MDTKKEYYELSNSGENEVSSSQVKEPTHEAELPLLDPATLQGLPMEYNNQHALSFVKRIMDTVKGNAELQMAYFTAYYNFYFVVVSAHEHKIYEKKYDEHGLLCALVPHSQANANKMCEPVALYVPWDPSFKKKKLLCG